MLSVKGLRKVYGSGAKQNVVFEDIDFEIHEGEMVSIVGPSGCGKTTLLRCISGLMAPTAGEVRLGGQPVGARSERVAVVFQDYSRSLYPWMTVRKNILFPLANLRDVDRAGKVARMEHAIHSVGLESAMDKYPWQLSGGMQQRVAIARALAFEPAILLMDEPFASVDAQTRANLEDLTLAVRREFHTTIAVVTHDIDESIYLGNRVIVLGSRPTRVLDIVDVDLPEDRDQIATKEIGEFSRLRSRVHGYMKVA